MTNKDKKSEKLRIEIYDLIMSKDICQERINHFEDTLKQNLADASKRFYLNFLLMVGLISIWFLFSNSIIDEVELAGLKLKNKEFIVILLPVLVSFIYMKSISLFMIALRIINALNYIYKLRYPDISMAILEALMIPPSFLGFEKYISTQESNSDYNVRLKKIEISIIGLLILVLPCCAIVFMIIPLFFTFSMVNITAIVLSLILLYRTGDILRREYSNI